MDPTKSMHQESKSLSVKAIQTQKISTDYARCLVSHNFSMSKVLYRKRGESVPVTVCSIMQKSLKKYKQASKPDIFSVYSSKQSFFQKEGSVMTRAPQIPSFRASPHCFSSLT